MASKYVKWCTIVALLLHNIWEQTSWIYDSKTKPFCRGSLTGCLRSVIVFYYVLDTWLFTLSPFSVYSLAMVAPYLTVYMFTCLSWLHKYLSHYVRRGFFGQSSANWSLHIFFTANLNSTARYAEDGSTSSSSHWCKLGSSLQFGRHWEHGLLSYLAHWQAGVQSKYQEVVMQDSYR